MATECICGAFCGFTNQVMLIYFTVELCRNISHLLGGLPPKTPLYNAPACKHKMYSIDLVVAHVCVSVCRAMHSYTRAKTKTLF